MPLPYLIALFIGLPIVELALLIELHCRVGLGATILVVLLTGVAGAALVRRQGLAILMQIQRELSLGNLPAPQMMDGVMILTAGALLVTPGLITDAAGFLLLVPYIRNQIRNELKRRLEKKIRSGYIQVHVRR